MAKNLGTVAGVGGLSIYSYSVAYNIRNTTSTVINNTTDTNMTFRLNTLTLTNTSSSMHASCTLQLFLNNVATNYVIWTGIVPAKSTITVISRDTSLYINYNDYIQVTSSDVPDSQVGITCNVCYDAFYV